MVELSPKAHKLHIAAGVLVALTVFAALVAIPIFSKPELNRLQTIQNQGKLVVLTLNGASTYYLDANGANGFEYHLAEMFAQHLDVDLEIRTVDNFADLYQELLFNSGDIAAAGLSELDANIPPGITFGPEYQQVSQQVLYRKGLNGRPKNLEDLNAGIVEVVRGTSHEQQLTELSQKVPDLSWRANRNVATEELIELVNEGLIDYLLADSHEIALQRRFYPELRVAFKLGEKKDLRWAMKASEDNSLNQALDDFFNAIADDGRLDQLIHRHFSQVEKFNYSDLQTFATHVRFRLPQYQQMFEQEAERQDLDWRLLAAIGYQESLWNPKAKSPTGVRGLMMLTQNTAKLVKINDRLDAEQSIRGGAIYFKRVLKKIPERIKQPDRTWLALASYNVGFGHLEDARKITQNQGGDPDKWIDIKERLPLLSKKKWYKNTKHGYARGWEPVKYVENIRKYYDLLVWMDRRNNEGGLIEPPQSISDDLTLPPSF